MRRYARRLKVRRESAAAYVPLSFAPGEAYQFDWSREIVLPNGAATIVKAAHVRICYSRMPFVRVYQRDAEMVFDARARAFAFFKGACRRGIYDDCSSAKGGRPLRGVPPSSPNGGTRPSPTCRRWS